MKLYKIPFLVFISLCILSCGKNDQDDEKETKETKKNIENTEIKDNQQSDSDTIIADSIRAVKESILRKERYRLKKDNTINDSVVNKKNVSSNKNITATTKKKNDLSFFYLKKILTECKVGETMTQKQLESNHNIPKDAIKLVKSVKKISPNQLDVKWKSTWLVEKMSDAKLNDGILKVRFEDNKMYTSGNAIGIKYDDTLYTDLVITGHTARIPTVKGYYWQIGKD